MRSGGATSHYIMTCFSAAEDKGLEILSTHRAVPWAKRKFVNLEKWGRLKPVKSKRALKILLNDRNFSSSEGVGVYWQGRFYHYVFSSIPASIRRSPKARLAVACLHQGALRGLGKEDFFFTRRPQAAVRWARQHRGWAFFLSPNSVKEVLQVATAGFIMPPKSTHFYPKIPSGMLSFSLCGEL